MKYLNQSLSFVLSLLIAIPALPQTSVVNQQSQDVNYILNGGFENSKAGWVAYKDTAQAAPVTGSGAGPTTTISSSTSAPIQGKSSGILTKTAANTQGEGISYAFKLDSAGKGRVVTISALYQIISGTYSGGTSTTDSDVEVYIYDVDAAQIIQPAGFKLDGGVSGFNYPIVATFQTSTTSSNYRLIFHEATTSASAYSIKLDQIKVGVATRSAGVIPKTPTIQTFTSGSGTYTPPSNPVPLYVRVRMVGGGGGGSGGGTAGTLGNGGSGAQTTFGSLLSAGGGGGGAAYNTNAGGTATITAPAYGLAVQGSAGTVGGYSIGANVAFPTTGSGGVSPFGGTAQSVVNGPGFVPAANTGAGGAGGGSSSQSSSLGGAGGSSGGYIEATISSPSVSYSYAIGSGGAGGAAGTSGASGGPGAAGYIEVTEYYLGTNVTMSSDSGGRTIAVRVASSTSQTYVSSQPTIVYNVVNTDKTGAYNSTTGDFTCQEPGTYRVASMFTTQNNVVAGGANYTFGNILDKNGVFYAWLGIERASNTTSRAYGASGYTLVDCVAGDKLTIRSYADTSTSSNSDATDNYATFEKINSGSQQIAASEKIFASYSSVAGQTFAANTQTRCSFTAKDFDTHNAWNGTTFTCPAPGTYRVTFSIYTDGVAGASSDNQFNVYKNGAIYKGINFPKSGTATVPDSGMGTALVPCNAGETLEAYHYQATGSTRTAIASSAFNWITIERVGN